MDYIAKIYRVNICCAILYDDKDLYDHVDADENEKLDKNYKLDKNDNGIDVDGKNE